MTLRIMLVGLVASLGFELPSGSDVSCWAQAGRSWFRSGVVDPSGPVFEPKLDRDGPSDCRQVAEKCEVPALVCEKEQAETDAAFQSVAETIASDLTADLLASHREEPSAGPVVAKVAIEEPAPAVLPEPEPSGCLVVPAVEAKTAEVAWTEEDKPTEVVEPSVESPSRADRVSSAVRLTREAVQAWAAVMQEPVGQ